MKLRRLQRILVAGHLFIPVGCAWGPAATLPLAPDVRVRVTQHRSLGNTTAWIGREGIITQTNDDMIVVRADDTGAEWSVPVRTIEHLEVRQQRSNVGKGAYIGAGVGLTLGVVTGLAAGEDCSRSNSFVCFEPADLAWMLGLTGAVGGTFIGSMVGAIIPPAQRWRAVPIELAGFSVGRQLKGSVGIGVHFAF